VGTVGVLVRTLVRRGKSVTTEANTLRLKMFLAGPVRVLEFGEEDARCAGEIRNTLERTGKPIGTYDLLIAGQALCRKLTLVTANAREFGRVKVLVLGGLGKRIVGTWSLQCSVIRHIIPHYKGVL